MSGALIKRIPLWKIIGIPAIWILTCTGVLQHCQAIVLGVQTY